VDCHNGSPLVTRWIDDVIKAAAFDVDGTLTHRDRSIDVDVIDALRRLTVPVVLATGNILCFANAAAVLIGKVSGVIAENGGVVSDGTSRIVSGNIEACHRAAEILESSGKFDLKRVDASERVTEIAYSKDTNFDVSKLKAMIAQCCSDVEAVDSGFAVHIKDRSVNKGLGLTKIAELLGLEAHDFAAFGDSENDAELLEIAGVGVAVGNADSTARAAADYVATEPYGAGVVEGLKHLSLL
jgi:phosphoglycolate phosphatase (TIGR01487 family)